MKWESGRRKQMFERHLCSSMETDVDWLKMSWKWKSLSRENAGPPAPRCFCFSPPHLHLVASWSVSSQAHFPKTTLIRPSVASSPPGWPVFCQKKKKKEKSFICLSSSPSTFLLWEHLLPTQTGHPARVGSSSSYQDTLLGLIFASEAPFCSIRLPLPYLHRSRS